MVKPIKNNVLVKPFPSDEMSTGGILLPESARRISNKMEVVEVGTGTKDRPMQFRKGQTVYRVKDWGNEVVIDGQLHFIMTDDGIIATE